jgi:hypothetical protein
MSLSGLAAEPPLGPGRTMLAVTATGREAGWISSSGAASSPFAVD